jgi:hypothetical protein
VEQFEKAFLGVQNFKLKSAARAYYTNLQLAFLSYLSAN